MANKCNHCGKFISTTDCAKCSKCAGVFHRSCVNVSPKKPISITWECRSCRSKYKQSSTTTTPETAQCEDPPSDINIMDQNPIGDLVRELKLFRTELSAVATEMTSFRQEMARLNSVINQFNSRMDRAEERLAELEAKSSVTLNEKEGIISLLRSELNDKEQEAMLNDITIAGIEERGGENLNQIVSLIATKIGVNLDERDIAFVERTGPRRVSTDSADKPRPRPVVVRLTRRAVRDNMLRSARVRRGADTAGVIEGQTRRFYINERLTRTNALLFFKTREEGRRRNWKFIWTNGGRIFIRKDSNSIVYRVTNENDIIKFFGE